jgi:hypothetical protein
MKIHNRDNIYVIGKMTSCETTFEGVRCLSLFEQKKVSIASNASSKFDPNVLVYRGLVGQKVVKNFALNFE